MGNLNKSRIVKITYMVCISLFLVVALILPVGTLFMKAFEKGNRFVGVENFRTYFSTPSLVSSLLNSIFVASVTTIIAMVLVFLYSYGIERTNLKGKTFFKWIAMLPLFAPTMTHGIALIYLFGAKGIVTTKVGIAIPIYGKVGVILGELIYVFPSLFLMLGIAFKMIDNRLYEAAETLGASKAKQFFTITIPNMKFSLISGFFASFTMVFTDFGVPKVIGGNYNLLATDIFKQVIGQQNITMGATVGILLIVPSIVSFIVDQVTNSNSQGDSKAREYVIRGNTARDIVFGIYNIILGILILVIFLVILCASVFKSWPYDLTLTFKWFTVGTYGLTPIKIYVNTLIVSAITAVLGTILVLMAAYLSERGEDFKILKRVIYFFSIMPLALPGLVVGLSFILFFNQKGNPLNIIYGTFAILVLANIVHFFSVPFLTITSSFKKIDREFENVSESMGIPWYKLLVNVIIPVSKPAILESFSYYFINSMMTISALVFLYTSKTKVASVEMINRFDSGEVASASAIAVLIIFTNMIFKSIFNKLIRKTEYTQKKPD